MYLSIHAMAQVNMLINLSNIKSDLLMLSSTQEVSHLYPTRGTSVIGDKLQGLTCLSCMESTLE